MENKKVSVIMGIYNCENTLRESIESIIKQTYKNWELIICDDCSTDKTYSLAKEYQIKYPEKIMLIKNERNLKLASTLNHCLKYATGEYIARMDGDDISLETRLEEQVNFLNKHNEYHVVGSQMISFDQDGERGVRGVDEIPDKMCLITHVPFAHATIMMRKEVYDQLDGYRVSKEVTRCEDVDLWFRFFNEGYKGYNIQKPLYKVREEVDAFKRRKLFYSIDTAKVCWKGYRMLGYPKRCYVFILKPIISSLIPIGIHNIYHKYKDSKNQVS